MGTIYILLKCNTCGYICNEPSRVCKSCGTVSENTKIILEEKLDEEE